MKIILVSILLFIVVRGIAEAEPFDLLLPLWAIVLICTLVDYTEKMAAVSPCGGIDTFYSPPRIPAHVVVLLPQE